MKNPQFSRKFRALINEDTQYIKEFLEENDGAIALASVEQLDDVTYVEDNLPNIIQRGSDGDFFSEFAITELRLVKNKIELTITGIRDNDGAEEIISIGELQDNEVIYLAEFIATNGKNIHKI